MGANFPTWNITSLLKWHFMLADKNWPIKMRASADWATAEMLIKI